MHNNQRMLTAPKGCVFYRYLLRGVVSNDE